MVSSVDSITGIDIIIEITRILMESGVGISQIETYIYDLSKSFKIKEMDVFAIPQFMSISYRDEKNDRKTITVKCESINTDLGKIESVCNLISEINSENEIHLHQIYNNLIEIRSGANKNRFPRIITYILVPLIFTFIFMGIGITQIKLSEGIALIFSSIASATAIYFGDKILSHARISDMFSKIFSSASLMLVVCVANWVCTMVGVNLYASYLLLGNIMLIVPGVKFTNGIRDMFSGNAISGIIQVLEAVLSTIGIVVGIIMIQRMTYCPIRTVPIFDQPIAPWYNVYMVLLTGLGTMFFSIYFQLDMRHLPISFFAGILTWIFYLGGEWLVEQSSFGVNAAVFVPNFVAAFVATVFSEVIAQNKQWPTMIVLFPAIISLVPGGSLYNVMYAIFSETVEYSDIVQMLYTVAGLCAGILAMASLKRIGIGLIDLIDKKSAKHAKDTESRHDAEEYLRKATELYNIAKRNLQKNPEVAYAFYCAADSNYEQAISKISVCDVNLKYNIYKEAGINAFWQYQCMVRMNRRESDQKKFLEVAKRRYEEAYKTLSDFQVNAEYEKKNCILSNWMAVMEINEARHEDVSASKKSHLSKARNLLQEAIKCDPQYDRAYLNLAEVDFLEVSDMMGFKYDEPIYHVTPPACIDKMRVHKLFIEIEECLEKVLIWNPKMPNVYYKMGQLQTYRIFYVKRVEGHADISWLRDEAEKWFFALDKGDRVNLAYLFLYREYLELVDIEMAKEVNKLIYNINPGAANKWELIISNT